MQKGEDDTRTVYWRLLFHFHVLLLRKKKRSRGSGLGSLHGIKVYERSLKPAESLSVSFGTGWRMRGSPTPTVIAKDLWLPKIPEQT